MGAREAVTKFMGSETRKFQGDNQSNLRDAIKAGEGCRESRSIGDRNSDGCAMVTNEKITKKGV